MKLISLWPWYSLALLLANIALALTAALILTVRGSLPRLVLLRGYLLYWAAGGILQLVSAVATPIGSLIYWHVSVALSVGADILLFLLCAEIVDQLIRRDDVQRAKKLWLFGLPIAFCVAVLAHSTLIPSRCIPALLAFDSFAALISALCIVATYITPPEDWLDGYKLIVAALGWQIFSLAMMNAVFYVFHCKGLDIANPSASLVTLALLVWAANRKEAQK